MRTRSCLTRGPGLMHRLAWLLASCVTATCLCLGACRFDTSAPALPFDGASVDAPATKDGSGDDGTALDAVGADAVGADAAGDAPAGDGPDSGAPPDASAPADAQEPEVAIRAGFRASRRGITPFPSAAYWTRVAGEMASGVADAGPGGIWIAGAIGDHEDCVLSFPSPGGSYPSITFTAQDQNEDYLSYFDAAGVRVWLEVEPGNAAVPTVIDLVLDRYGGHPSVLGMGVDVEWHRSSANPDGMAVTDARAQAWSERVRAHNPAYTLFLMHWLPSKMPPTYREGLVFIDDSQELYSLQSMVSEFEVWGSRFAPAPVGFQFGYESDRSWWARLADPPADISQALVSAIPNTAGLFWVDFTVTEAFPP